jgi:hypothetical protein
MVSHPDAIWQCTSNISVSRVQRYLLQVNTVAAFGPALAQLHWIDRHSRPPWQGPPSSLSCAAISNMMQHSMKEPNST